ncbi:MAG: histidine--tRNA ligase [Candidatus Jacksonbacteria bacterium RIFOXYC2_FULL_44_29]|nr:MAG: Histidine-tRNA ligase [Parcubacteria group bacterium GW2011_GWC2_44_22]OGY75481.1 MAG: histidine--tRNA ligase [Candidatus Jacksonbacteria bacterium RIFOXYA2_FULL_43_12]OGY76977.1 MAG: histidine--tRNA ligase [Candidatus Jacksonbacteria bacterium RIFOXYB2_FULL_44_15]OGY77829.1 MAG: histidine--tRNA ligase [Candidatus Jacksonbacteria bacterium RIFOXYC2_FULL_44_29]OGY80246.1 MAG: histidine--tRNA ligase [Candidatus Jacksonbacteria bacterium RIFOXYD2_FULL_43_21]HBH46122.1 histidine--tRNA liga
MPKRRNFQSLRGMRDILPQDAEMWQWVLDKCREVALAYGYSPIETPLLEAAELFKRSVGSSTDIVQKEMFAFKDHGGEEVALRPEFTASVARAYIEHGLTNQPKPVKLFQIGPCFRGERPQSGRLRQFHQFNVEVLGSAEAITDAELIALAYVILRELGLEVVVQVNSIGTPESRRTYIKKLKEFYQPKLRYLCSDCRDRYKNNPLRLLDCKKKKCGDYCLEVPQIVDYLDEESKDHLMKLLEALDDFDLPYVLNPQIVRGLDYYTRTAFEIWSKEDGGNARTTALGGGGRYDGLIELIGGRETPACGFALGLERIVSKLREKNIKAPTLVNFDIFLAHLGEVARKKIFAVFEELRRKKYRVTFNLSKTNLKQQLELANKLGVKLVLILGEKEVAEHEILIKEMESGVQESIAIDRLEKELDKRLKN